MFCKTGCLERSEELWYTGKSNMQGDRIKLCEQEETVQ